jgi:tetratricopeptide (TPR) repeat protein
MENQVITEWSERNKIRLLILIAAALLFFVLAETAWSIDYGVPGRSVGSATVPPSSVQSGLIRSPNPIDTSRNLVITGNVTGGKYFRGPVPYSSTNAFRGPLGSSSMDSFLRDSAGGGSFDRYIGGYTPQPYYSPTGTVTTMVPGQSGVVTPSSARISDRAPGLENLPKRETLPQQDTSTSDISSRSLLVTPQRIDKLLSEQGATIPRTEKSGTDRYQMQVEQLRRELQQLNEKMSQLRQKMDETSDLSGSQIPIEDIGAQPGPTETLRQQLEQPGIVETQIRRTPKEPPKAPALQPVAPEPEQQLEQLPVPGKTDTGDVYKHLKQQLDKLQASQKEKPSGVTENGLQQLTAAERRQVGAASQEQPGKEESYLEALRKGRPDAGKSYLDAMTKSEKKQKVEGEGSVAGEVKELSAAELSTEAKRIMGPHKNLESYSQAKFDQAIAAAETYLKQGRYYLAADSYAMASIYKPDDAATFAGRAHALFVAGEYISSALFLGRAIELSPEYVQRKVDLVALLADKDKLDSRMADLEGWLERTGAPELRFLLAYLYYRMDRYDRAKFMIDIAAEKLPKAPAVQTLGHAIDSATKAPKTQ